MARCKNCIHFSICKKGFPWADGKGGGWCEDFLTADVVPREEVDNLKVEFDAMRSAANSYKMHYQNIAKEIFKDIDDIFLVLTRLTNYYAEIKEKYTEGE